MNKLSKLLLNLIFLNFFIIYSKGINFEEWIIQYNKQYSSIQEKIIRYNIWLSNNEYIDNQNNLKLSFNLEINKYADLTWEEFKNKFCGYNPNINKNTIEEIVLINDNIPINVNWTEKGVVTQVKNQFMCGSCWAFSTTGAIESAYAIKTGKLISLSEENLLDCSFEYGNNGCGGGLPTQAMNYVIANKGIDTELSYPLVSVFFTDCLVSDMCPCEFNKNTIGAQISSYKSIISRNETNLQNAIANIGPISVAIDVTKNFQFYKSGVFNDTLCSSINLNHAVLAVGYGITNEGLDYYIVKNSWGLDWGMNGYILMARNQNNMCGIATDAIYPII